ncbi:MAG: hypothetical protein J3R72DRAFT_435534 [Linnemannia gamsii]|nr:MAG: hypothetical protein J3R72DRAFT_435534 [Linnemannia gamsii]
MLFKTLIFSSFLALAAASAIPEVARSEVLPQVLHGGETPVLEARSLLKRSCTYNGCRCNISSGGLACLNGNIYQCSPTGGCCIFGPSSRC